MDRTHKILPILLVLLLAASCSPPREAEAPWKKADKGTVQMVRDKLGGLCRPVTIRHYFGGKGEVMGEEMRLLLDLIRETCSITQVEPVDLARDPEAARRLGVSHGPVLEVWGEKPSPILYYGYPGGEELPSFLNAVIIASGQSSPLAGPTEAFLRDLDRELSLLIFVSRH